MAESSASKPSALAVSSPPDSGQAKAETIVLDDSDVDSPRKGHLSMDNEEPAAFISGTAEITDISGDSSGPMVRDDLDFADQLLAISMKEEDHRQNLWELESL